MKRLRQLTITQGNSNMSELEKFKIWVQEYKPLLGEDDVPALFRILARERRISEFIDSDSIMKEMKKYQFFEHKDIKKFPKSHTWLVIIRRKNDFRIISSVYCSLITRKPSGNKKIEFKSESHFNYEIILESSSSWSA